MPVTITTFDGFADRQAQGRPSGPYTLSTNSANLYAVTLDTATNVIRIYQSTNTGTTWAEANAAGHPTCYNGTATVFKIYDSVMASDTISVAYIGTGTDLRVAQFAMGSATWGSTFTGGPTVMLTTHYGGVELSMVRQSTGVLVIGYSALPAAGGTGTTSNNRIGLTALGTNGTFTAISTAYGTSGFDYRIGCLLLAQSDRVQIPLRINSSSYNHGTLAQVALTTAGTLGAETNITVFGTPTDAPVVYPGSFRASDNHIIIPYINSSNAALTVAEATDADTPTFSTTNLTGLSTKNNPVGGGNLLMAATNTNGDSYIFFGAGTSGNIEEFNNVGGGWVVNDAPVLDLSAAVDSALSVSAHIAANSTCFDVMFSDFFGTASILTSYLRWCPTPVVTSFIGMIWNPPNITY